MELLSNLSDGFAVALTLNNLFYCFVGVLLGTFIGVLPGIGAIAAISMLLPVTFYLDPTAALVMLAGVYYGSEYGGAIASILLNLPGTTSSAVVCLDGYPMSQQGRAGVALFTSMISSFIGGILGTVFLVVCAPLLASVALAFGPSEYFAIMVLGLLGASAIAQGSPVKGVAMVIVGLLIGCIGTDLNSGIPRFTFGFPAVYDGVNVIAIAMGLFGVSEVIASVSSMTPGDQKQKIRLRDMVPTREDIRRCIRPILRGSSIGIVVGALPGTGQTVASFMSYAVEKRVAKDPSKFGTGMIEGVAAPEASNNAASQTAFVPTLTLGIPGSASMALILGALMIHGITPGPLLMVQHPDIFWGLIASFWIGNVMLVVLNIPMIGLWVWFLTIPYRYLYPVIIALLCIGVYSVKFDAFDVGLVFFLGLFGYVLRILGYSPAPLLIGFILGPLLEENFRRAMIIDDGRFMSLLEHPLTASLLGLSLLLVLWTAYTVVRTNNTNRPPLEES